MNQYDKRHIANVRKYQRQIDAIYKKATEQVAARSVSLPVPDDYIFSFDDFPAIKAEIDALIRQMGRDIEFTVQDGVKTEWSLANEKNDALIASVYGEAATAATIARRTAGADAFLQRKQSGMTISDRVWKYTSQFRSEIEMGLDCGIRDGRSAAAMARDLQKYLQHPDMLFRRVRDEHGILQLSQRAAAYHPGQGVYRSSYKNARRLAATETNIAYRTSDHERWQQENFVVGIRVQLSNNHTCLNAKGVPEPFTDICDELAGDYPKDFKFTGWHPQCRCIATPILKTKEERKEDRQRRMRGEEPLPPESSENAVKELPDNFKQWMQDNEERVARAKSLPYFIKDNEGIIAGGSKYGKQFIDAINEPKPLTPQQIADQRHAERTQADIDTIQERWQYRQVNNLLDDLNAGLLPSDSLGAIDYIKDSIALGDYEDAKIRIARLQAAVRRHAARTAEMATSIRERWYDRSLIPVKPWSASSTQAKLKDIAEAAAKYPVDYLEVKVLSKPLSGEEIVNKLAGGDLTGGSCSSLAFSYCGNRAGLDVTDYRGSSSRHFFATTAEIKQITTRAGGTIAKNYSDFENATQLLARVETGKEYYFTCGSHAAMVRKIGDEYQYLEMQSAKSNGWKKLDKTVLKNRFGAKRSHSSYGQKYESSDCLIEVSQLAKDKEFKKMLGYINTDAAKQKKGIKGRIR